MGEMSLVRALVRKGNLDINLQTETKGLTALYIAIDLGDIDLINFLLQAGADPLICNYSGDNCFVYNIKRKTKEINHQTAQNVQKKSKNLKILGSDFADFRLDWPSRSPSPPQISF